MGEPGPGPIKAKEKEMLAEVAEVQQRIADLHAAEPAAAADAPLLDEEQDKVTQICSATGTTTAMATSFLRRARGDTNIAVAEVFAHKNRVAKGWVKEEQIGRTKSDPSGRTVLWIDLIGGERIRYSLDFRERSNPLNHWFQVIITGPYGQSWTSSAVRRNLAPMFKEQVPFVLPTSSVVYLQVTVVSLDVDFDYDLIFGDDAMQRAVPQTARHPRAPMRTTSEPARVNQGDNPLLGPDLDAVQDDFDVHRTKTSDRVRESAAKYALADDSQGSEDLLLRLLRRRLATTQKQFADNRITSKLTRGAADLCSMCKKKATSFIKRGPELQRSCGHVVCYACLAEHVSKQIASGSARHAVCPCTGCDLALTPAELKRILPEKDYDAYENACLSEFLGTNEMGRCPKCQATFIIQKNSRITDAVAAEGIDLQKKNKDGKAEKMSKTALKHYNAHRFRCTDCGTSFCMSCQATPFHAGYPSCDAYALAVSGRSCRWCETVLTEENIWSNYQCKGVLKNTCREAACVSRAKAACLKLHECGHECGGVKNESEHLPCLKCNAIEGVAHDDFCPICWTEGLSLAPTLQLACGHLVHDHCVRKQLDERWGDQPQIKFNFLACPACRQDIFHESLEKDYIKPLTVLRERVKAMAAEQMKIEYPMMEPEEQAKADAAGHDAYAEVHLSFEQCHRCQLPYFAGRVDCAAGVDGPAVAAVAADGVCEACRTLSGLNKTCPKHGKDALMWKCRYGCHLATYECFGYLHVCTPCHGSEILCNMMDFNSRVKEGHPRRGGVPGNEGVYPNKKDVWDYDQCPGPDKCPLGVAHPPTGIEYCFGCSLCNDEEALRQKTVVPLLPVFARLAEVAQAGHTDDFDDQDMVQLETRLRHAAWLVGAQAARESTITKRQGLHMMQYLMQAANIDLNKYDVSVKGNPEALRKRVRPHEVASVVEHWRKEPEVLAAVSNSTFLTVTLDNKPNEPTVTVAARFLPAGKAVPDGTLAGKATVAELMTLLVSDGSIPEKHAKKVVLTVDGSTLDPATQLMSLMSGPAIGLHVKASASLLDSCRIS